MTAVSHLQKQAPSRIKRTRNEIQRPGRLSNGRESAGIAVNVAAVFDVAAFRDGAVRIDVDQNIIMTGPAVVDHCSESPRGV